MTTIPPSQTIQADPPALLLYPGGHVTVGQQVIAIGRASDNDVVLEDPLVSEYHARVGLVSGEYRVVDLDSDNATLLNGERLRRDSRSLTSGDTVSVGNTDLRFVAGVVPTELPSEPILGTRQLRFTGARLRIGRHLDNDVVLDDPKVSQFHAEISASGDEVFMRDLGTISGTRVNGQPASRAALVTGTEIGIGSFRLIFGDDSILARDDRQALRLDAQNVTVKIGGKTILAPTTLSVGPGEFVAIIGGTGAGKSTLLKALAGSIKRTAGSVLISGEPIAARLSEIGYLPQDEIVNPHLTVREALRYSARLRLPDDATKDDLEAAVERVLDELELVAHADTQIAFLSGGQRKRAGLGTELLSQPGLIFLDEATTGVDPPLEGRLMKVMRNLAEHGRGVVTITHATGSLHLAHKLAVMGEGGELCFYGPPPAALEFFAAARFSEIYERLEERPASEWRRKFETSEHAPPAPSERDSRETERLAVRGRRSAPRQTRVLLRRYGRAFARDRANLVILFVPVPLLAALLAVIFRQNPFVGSGRDASTFLFLLVTTAIWFGALGAAREIVKERTSFVRERDVGVRNGAYLASKVALLFVVVAAQMLVITGVSFAVHPLHEPPRFYAGVTLALLLSGFLGVAFGLLVSALATREDQAVSALPYLLIPQLALAGALVPVAKLGPPVAALTYPVFARWSFQTVGSVAKIGNFPALGPGSAYGHFFTLPWEIGLAIMLVSLALLLAGILRVLRRPYGP